MEFAKTTTIIINRVHSCSNNHLSTMSIHHNYSRFSILAVLLVLNYSCTCISSQSVNASLDTFYPAVATWYGSPTGAGSGGACGLADDVMNFPYYAMISAGNQNLYYYGKGCGACYLVKCTDNPQCSGNPIKVTITDECPGACNNEAVHFDLSGTAFGALAKNGQADALRNAGRINVQYRRVKCTYNAAIKFKIDAGSNQYYIAFVPENVNGSGDIGNAEILSSNPGTTWRPMQRSWGATWKADLPSGTYGPYSVRLTNLAFTSSVTANNVIPYDWAPGRYYDSKVNFP